MGGRIDGGLIVPRDRSQGVDSEREEVGHAGESEGDESTIGQAHKAVRHAVGLDVEACNPSGVIDAGNPFPG